MVFLPGLVDGTVPIVYATSTEAVQEERRLLYVGITRARDQLFLSWSLARSPGSRQTRRPSRFLDGLAAAALRPGWPARGSPAPAVRSPWPAPARGPVRCRRDHPWPQAAD